jgi:hypothetical protein
VVKSLILPVLNHLFIALPNPSIEIIKDIEDKRLNSNTGKTRKEQQQYRPFLCQTPNF